MEEFRPYYSSFTDLLLGVYENWEDGLFVDNTDVYYNFPTEEIYQGVTDILLAFKSKGTYVSINGGDAYVTEYYSREGEISSIMDGENQETLFSAINWEEDEFTSNPLMNLNSFPPMWSSAAITGPIFIFLNIRRMRISWEGSIPIAPGRDSAITVPRLWILRSPHHLPVHKVQGGRCDLSGRLAYCEGVLCWRISISPLFQQELFVPMALWYIRIFKLSQTDVKEFIKSIPGRCFSPRYPCVP